ncbi:uncharacterized protein LOC110848893 [Folsomia candida]|uniref:Baculoviral IAP repeat-containing protein 5.2-A n=1 Tax=Folsomia candida TaxID=158441 RepID=A0A226EGI8_FOLCA|nr:uncharacterized protein LOC110848893 [Folsomia candida]OXA56338.1 Baculoviral IAP repeat-containing protein 5.2-A [Folsomia candida]
MADEGGTRLNETFEIDTDDKGIEFDLPIESGGLYRERVKSFTDTNWPYVDPTTHSCTPEELSMSGFMCCTDETTQEKVIKCFACNIAISAHDLGPDSEPWYIHLERSPDCPYLQLGKKKFPRDYTFRDISDILFKKLLQVPTLRFQQIEDEIRKIAPPNNKEEQHNK